MAGAGREMEMTQGLMSSTIFSLVADPPAALALEPGGHAELDSACLVDQSGRYGCSLRKLSAAGATLRLDSDVTENSRLNLELANGQSLPSMIAWRLDEEAGFLFDEPIDVVGTLARNLAALPAERRSVPRVELQQMVSVHHDGETEFTRARNISQGGIGIETQIELSPGDRVHIVVDGLRPLDGTVKWAREGQAGIAFEHEIAWQVLMPWLRQMQQMPARPVRTPLIHEPQGMIPDQHAIRLDAPARVREGTRWWNVKLRGLTSQLVEFETRAAFAPGAQLWISLPNIGGGPASVIEADHDRFLCEFRLPLRQRELGLVAGR